VLTRRKFIRLSAASVFAPAVVGRPAFAQAWPNRLVKIIVPFPAGGGADAIARIMAAKLSELWGQQIVIENRGGAAGNLASDAAARSTPDGYTLFLAGDFLAANIHLYSRLSYDPIADFVPVSLVVLFPNVLVVPNSSPAHTVKEFIAHAKANKGKVTFASAGHGTSPHLVGELFKRQADIDLVHVPYRGAAPAINDLVPGHVDSFFNNIAPLVTLLSSKQVRGLAVTTAKRSPVAPDLPTFAEAGMTGLEVPGWYAFFFPNKTPADIVKKVHADTVTALADSFTKGRLEQLGLFVIGSTPAELARFHRAEMDKWGPVIKEAGIRVE
jgi:tripartite-type tricarboxylate transporter receptor subunit TctC